MKLELVVPWKFSSTSPAKELCEEYAGRIDLEIRFPKSQPSSEKIARDFLIKETMRARELGMRIVCLDEAGKVFSSVQFADWLAKKERQSPKGLCLVIGGAYGLPGELGDVDLISLSPLTMSHELASVVLCEQLYRAQCIRTGHPYHHGDISALALKLRAR